MSKIKNINCVEGIVHQAFHLVAQKHKIDVDKVAEIYTDCQEWMDKNLRQKNATKLRSKNYSKIIQVNVPARFYWTEEGYDGLEFGPFKKITPYEIRLIHEILKSVSGKLIVADACVLCECGAKHKLLGGLDAPVYWCGNELKVLKEGQDVEYNV